MRVHGLVAGAVLVAACASRAPAPSDEPPAVRPLRAPLLPPDRALAGGAGTERFTPSLMNLAVTRADAGTVLTDVDTCAGCHADVAAMWRTSAHAFGSFNNPIYRASVDRFRHEKGETTSRWCGGCHDIALMSDVAMDRAVEASEPRAHGGITCRTCHGITNARVDGDGSYDLDTTPMPIPREGDAASVALHKQKAAPAPLRTTAMCTTCHRVFLDEASGNARHIPGQDDATPWARSVYAASLSERIDELLPERDCKSCHMAREEAKLGDVAAKNGTIASHRFLGAHTWLASMRGDADQLARTKAFLAGSASIDVSAVRTPRGRTFPADGASIVRGDDVVLAVTLRNLRVGHRFPGGVVDAADAWVEVTVDDARGRRLAEAGTHHAVDPEDDTAHVLRATLLDDEGQPVRARETDRFRAVVANHTLAPRDAEVVEYAFDVPPVLADAAFPLKVTARLRHRTRSLAVQRLVCTEAATPRARSFREEGRRRTGVTLDPCKAQPITEIATSTALVGGARGGPVGPVAPATTTAPAEWQRLYDYGLGLSHGLQEWVGEARPPLERALEVAPGNRERAMVLSILAQVASREGRPEEAIAWADRAEPLAPAHPALARVRGDALANVWRWVDAIPHLETAARLAPRDDSSFTRLALAAGSAGLHAEAIEAARRGLALQPRDADLLRVQSLALPALGATTDVARSAEEAYLRHRAPDDTPGIRAKCSRDVPGCALERNPVHTHAMRTTPAR